MNNVANLKQISEASPHVQARFVAVYYLLTLTAGAFVLSFHGKLTFIADLVMAVFYLSVTALLYGLSRPLSRHSNSHR